SAAVYATFSPVVSSGLTKSGAVGIVSQSGAFAAYAYGMARERNVGLSSWVATGNEVDIEVADCIAWMARDPGTRIILAYMEGCQDGAKLKQALASARAAGKPVVMVKVGRTELGAQAAASHTAALAGNDAAFDTLLRQYGVWRARTIDEFFDIAHCFTVSGLPCNNKVGLLTVSGGVGALMADDAAEAGLDVAPMPESARALILARVPFAATRNPVDVTGQVTVEGDLLKLAAETMLREGDYGSLVVFLAAAGLTPSMQEVQKSLARDLREAFPQCLVIFSALSTPAQQRALEQLGCLTFADPGRAIRVLAALGFLANQSEESCSQPAPAHAPTKVVLRPGAYNEADALALLREHGIATPEVRRARTRDDAIREASALGFPVVMKVLSSQITHKSDMGGVVLNIQDAHQASRAYESIVSSVGLKAPGAVIEGVLVAPMVRAGVECILGVHLDPVVGPLVMLGAGGVHVELLKDVSFRVAPVDIRQARAMIDELKSVPLLKGYRGAPPADVEALADAIVRISEFAMAAGNSLEAIDLNPFCVLPEGQGVAALDAVILGRETESSANLQQLVLQTLPLFEMTRMRSANTARKHAVEGFAGQGAASAMRWVNQFTHTRNLLGPDDREVVTPNNDTLFTNAWLDLSDGPLVIDVPEMGDRYWTLGFLDAWTNPWAYAGRRTTGGAQQKILVHGPDWQGVPPKGMHIVSAPGADVWIIGRILVEHEPEDLQRVHALQNRFAIARLDGSSALKRVDTLLDGRQTGVPPAHEYVRVATQMILRNPSRHPVSAWPSRLDDLDLALEAVYAELREANGRAELGGGWTTAVSV
ncbi:acetate--CoA ligase family protein, partial [Hydrogenophaga sp.]|uniref:acetate--CoA ligase family protein n=1 Tax=Hydrogenophaga sp. TaxID=1904254 RepID=UPI00356AA82F